ncbi:MAG: YlbF family regulator [Spirochaetes bacterium]|nr:YlbF family regulator [Spirochaetota bacterium]
MSDEVDLIIEKAKELSASIRGHELTLRYNECLARMNNDRTAQDLYMKLVSMGKELNDIMASGGVVQRPQTSEYEIMQRDLEQNSLVREYIQAQADYLDLLKRVIEKIKNPD